MGVEMRVVYQLIVTLIAVGVLMALTFFILGAKDREFPVFGKLGQAGDPLYGTHAVVTLACTDNTHRIEVKELKVVYTDVEQVNVYPVLIWGNKVKTNGIVSTLYPAGEGNNNIPTIDVEIKFDERDEIEPIPPPRKAELKITMFKENAKCMDIALKGENGRKKDGVKKYDADFGYFTDTCAGHLLGTGPVEFLKIGESGEVVTDPMIIECDESETFGS